MDSYPNTRSGGIRELDRTGYSSSRLRDREGFNARNYEAIGDYWDGKSRPAFDEDTVVSVLKKTASREKDMGTQYKCPNCGGWYYQKRTLLAHNLDPDIPGFISIDHTALKGFREIIWKVGEPDETGKILKSAAKIAYNDERFLEPLCSKCNSGKSATKNIFD